MNEGVRYAVNLFLMRAANINCRGLKAWSNSSNPEIGSSQALGIAEALQARSAYLESTLLFAIQRGSLRRSSLPCVHVHISLLLQSGTHSRRPCLSLWPHPLDAVQALLEKITWARHEVQLFPYSNSIADVPSGLW